MIIGYCALLFSLCCALVSLVGLFVPQRRMREERKDYREIYKSLCPYEL